MNKIDVLKEMNKQAFDLQPLVNTLVSSIKNLIDPQNPITSVLQIITEGFIFSKWGWAAGIIATILDKVFNVNIKTLFATIRSSLGSFMPNNINKPVNIEEVSNMLTNDVLSKNNISSQEANKSFEQILQEQPEIQQQAQLIQLSLIKHSSMDKIAFFGAISKMGLFGIIKAIIKAALIGAGFSAAGNVMVSTVKDKPENLPATETSQIQSQKFISFGEASGLGQKYFANDADIEETKGSAWYIPAINGLDIFIYDWIFEIYPNMPENIKNIVDRNIKRILPIIKREFYKWNPSTNIDMPNEVRVPTNIGKTELHSVKDIVDLTLSILPIK